MGNTNGGGRLGAPQQQRSPRVKQKWMVEVPIANGPEVDAVEESVAFIDILDIVSVSPVRNGTAVLVSLSNSFQPQVRIPYSDFMLMLSDHGVMLSRLVATPRPAVGAPDAASPDSL